MQILRPLRYLTPHIGVVRQDALAAGEGDAELCAKLHEIGPPVGRCALLGLLLRLAVEVRAAVHLQHAPAKDEAAAAQERLRLSLAEALIADGRAADGEQPAFRMQAVWT